VSCAEFDSLGPCADLGCWAVDIDSVAPPGLRRISIVGPTASGKSDLGLRLAEALRGEIISGDSMCVYRGMDIGTAKPDHAERGRVPHHLIDVVDIDTDFSVSAFCDLARPVLADLAARRTDAILVGGTGLYVDSLIGGLTQPPRFPGIRAELEAAEDGDQLYAHLQQLDPLAASRMEATNRRRVERALEVCLGTGQPFSSFGPGVEASQREAQGWTILGIEIDRETLDRRIRQRYATQLDQGFLYEVQALESQWSGRWSRTAKQGLGYRQLLGYLRGEYGSVDEAIEVACAATLQFAKRQQRWFRRNPNIRWLALDEAVDTELLLSLIRP
jgi:tRNA dimethylallyltransferase